MQNSKLIVDPEIEKLKLQLKAAGVMAVTAAIFFLLGLPLPLWLYAPTAALTTAVVLWWSFKLKERKVQVGQGVTK